MFRTLVTLASLGTSAAFLAGFFGFYHPAFDTLAHFRFHLAVVLAVLGVFLLWSGMRRRGALMAVIALAGAVTCWQALPAIIGAKPWGDKYSMLQANLRFDNPDPQLFLDLVAREEPDILNVQEVSESWMPRLKGLEAQYPHVFHCPEWSSIGGVMLLSKLPLLANGRNCHDYASLGSAIAVFDDIEVTLGSVHLRWPWPASGPRQIDALRDPLSKIGVNALVGGDFNATVWSHAVQRFAEYGAMTLTTGIGPSWMWDGLPAALASCCGLPIDNVLVKGAVRISSARTLAPIGSDHLPILVEFSIDDSDCCKVGG